MRGAHATSAGLTALLAVAVPVSAQQGPVLTPDAAVAGDESVSASDDKPVVEKKADVPGAAFEKMDGTDKTMVANFAHCIVARHAGDMRWFALVVSEKSGISPEVTRGVMQNAVNAMRVNCPALETHSKDALTYAAALMRVHPGAVNLPTETDALADCVATHMPEQAAKFLAQSDGMLEKAIQAKVDDKSFTIDPKKIMDSSFGGKLAKQCQSLAPAKGALDIDQFYSRVNWVVRAKSALAIATTASQAGGR